MNLKLLRDFTPLTKYFRQTRLEMEADTRAVFLDSKIQILYNNNDIWN